MYSSPDRGQPDLSRSLPQRRIRIGGRDLEISPVFDTYWTFAARRQAIYEARQDGQPGPWTEDKILNEYKFTNCFRAADRVSQHLIARVIYEGSQAFDEVFLRVLLFKLFNKVETWQLLVENFGTPTLRTFDVDAYSTFLSEHFFRGRRLYSAAYVMPPPQLGAGRKHENHLRLLESMINTDLPLRLQRADSMADAFELLKAFPAIGNFLAFQFLIDLNYSTGLDYDEMDFVVAGPGAKDGIRKCFGPRATGIEAEVIRYMCDSQDVNFERLELTFKGLRGRRLQLIDCQNLFCEVDKYSRVAHPEVLGISGRSRIKQAFKASTDLPAQWFPPKWGLNNIGVRDTTAS